MKSAVESRESDRVTPPIPGDEPGPDNLDDYRLAFNRTDFQNIDTNGSNSLELDELKTAEQNGKYTPAQKEALRGLQCHIESSPKLGLTFGDQKIETQAVIPSWFDTDFAKGQITQEDFDIIDKNHNGTLSRDELFAAKRSGQLSPMTKHAANILKDHLDMVADDPLLAIRNPEIKDWILTPEQREAQDKAERLADYLTRPIKETTPKGAPLNYLMRKYSEVQRLWDLAGQMQGTAAENFETLMNRELRDTGHSIKVHSTTEQNIPRLPWMRDMEAFMTINPRPGTINTQMWGHGIIGLGRKDRHKTPADQ